jgi:hypothetical protein
MIGHSKRSLLRFSGKTEIEINEISAEIFWKNGDVVLIMVIHWRLR